MITKLIQQVSGEMALQVEEYIKLKIKPVPWWCPEKLWYRMASKFVYLERLDR